MEETNKELRCEPKIKRFTLRNVIKFSTITTLAISFGYIHYRYVSYLFENDRNFSYLSEMEREMSLRTEMGFYYSYYKTLVEERPFIAGISKLMYDRLVEYPKDVNAFNRFNIHPEVVMGALYHYFEPWLNTTRQCHMVDRGEGLAPVESCVGIGQPIMFYLEAIWWLAGLAVAGLFLHAVALSESILGGVLAVAQYFANHAECTRVQWAPNERENLALPLLLLQAWLVSLQLRLTDKERRTTFQLQVSIFLLNCLCLLFWQFTQFIFLTQTAILFVMEQLRIIDVKALCVFLHSHFCGLHMAVLLLQGNDMLKSSLYTSFFLVVSAYSLFCSSFRIKVQNRLDLFVETWLVLIRITLVVLSSFYLKKLISDFLQVQEDTHVWEILFAKFSDYKSFHTLLYTCSEVFDFLPWSSIRNLIVTFLIPISFFSVFNVCNYWSFNAVSEVKKEMEDKKVEADKDDDTDDSGIENNAEGKEKLLSVKENETKDKCINYLKHLNVDAAIFYNVSQMAVFGVMAALVMRLKLLFSTQMCVVCSLMMNTKYYVLPKSYMKYVPVLWLLCVSPLVQNMIENVTHEMSHVGEFSDLPQEELLQWIHRSSPAGAAFAGSMPLLAAVMLVTRRPVVAHPHYEHFEARVRAYTVYKVYGKFTPQELYQDLSTLRATYLIVETKYCYGRSSKGCSFGDIWDVEVPGSAHRPQLCHTLLTESVDHFYQVFRNDQYAVFRIHDYSVRYMPRSFET